MVVDEIPVPAQPIHCGDHASETRPARTGRECLEVARGEHRGIEARDRTDPDALAIEPGARTALRPGELAVRRGGRHAEHQPVAPQQRDLGGEERRLTHERLGAIDGIDEPDAFRIHGVSAGLLTEEPVGREVP